MIDEKSRVSPRSVEGVWRKTDWGSRPAVVHRSRVQVPAHDDLATQEVELDVRRHQWHSLVVPEIGRDIHRQDETTAPGRVDPSVTGSSPVRPTNGEPRNLVRPGTQEGRAVATAAEMNRM